jgi:hypothetical protein
MRNALVSIVACMILASIALDGCSSPDITARTSPAAPDRSTFKPLAIVLVSRCGSLDCHGSAYRNMRLYGFGSARLDPADRPDTPDTTNAESDADYDAVVALEPEIMAEVVAGGGKDYERLTLVRKARNEEAHKGGEPIVPGTDADRCLLSWLASSVDQNACKSAGGR